MELNNFQIILSAAWNLMCTEFTIYGFTISYGLVFCFSLLSGFAATAIFKILWG